MEFDNVLVVLGRGWSRYNWNQFLEWSQGNVPAGRNSSYELNRNLFYVACSRAKNRLALLFTQNLSTAALTTLAEWFGEKSIHSITAVPTK
jgi:DNA helicase-2/ATP-dependent DNA helicase PcrA